MGSRVLTNGFIDFRSNYTLDFAENSMSVILFMILILSTIATTSFLISVGEITQKIRIFILVWLSEIQ